MAFLGGVSTDAQFSKLKDGITVSNGNIEDEDNNVIYNNENSHVPTTILQDDSLTISGGNGISGAGSVSLGGSNSISVDASNFMSAGTNGISVNIGTGLTGDGSDNIILDESTSFSFTSDISFESAINVGDSVKEFFGANDDFSQFFDPSNDELAIRDEINDIDLIRQPKTGPTNFLQGVDAGPITAPEDSFSQIINQPVTSALASGSQVGYSLSLDNQNIIEINGEANGAGDIQNTTINLNRNVDIIGNDLIDSSTTIYDSSNSHIPTTVLESNSVTVSTGTGISGGGSFSLGGSGISISLTNTDITVNGSNGLSGGTVSLGGSVSVGISGTLSLDSDLQAVDDETIWDESNTHVPESALQTLSNSALTNSSISINGTDVSLGNNIDIETAAAAGSFLSKNGDIFSVNLGAGLSGDGNNNITLSNDAITISTGTDLTGGGSVSLGSTLTINHANTSNQGDVSTGGATVIDDIGLDSNGHINNLNTENRRLDQWANPNSRLDLDGNGINFNDPTNSNAASGAINIGFVDFSNEEFSDTPQNASTMAYDASEGFLFNDNIELSGSLNEGAAL